MKGAVFYDLPNEIIDLLNLHNVDFLIAAEEEIALKKLVSCIFGNRGTLSGIENIFYKDSRGKLIKNKFGVFYEYLDNIPFPARYFKTFNE